MTESRVLNPTSQRHDVFITSADRYDQTLYPHCHLGYELSLIVDGTHVIETENWTCQMGAGQIALVRPMEVHTRRLLKAGHFISVEFPREEMQSVLAFLKSEAFDAAVHGVTPFSAVLSPGRPSASSSASSI